jgi:hypothetical protein
MDLTEGASLRFVCSCHPGHIPQRLHRPNKSHSKEDRLFDVYFQLYPLEDINIRPVLPHLLRIRFSTGLVFTNQFLKHFTPLKSNSPFTLTSSKICQADIHFDMLAKNQVIAASCGGAALSIILLALLAVFIYRRQKTSKRAPLESEPERSVFMVRPHKDMAPFLFGPNFSKTLLRDKAAAIQGYLMNMNSSISDEAIPSDSASSATFSRLIENFGPVHMQKSSKELLKLLKKPGASRSTAVFHFLTTTIITCIDPESEASLSLLTPCLVDLHRLCRQPEMENRLLASRTILYRANQ